MHTPNFINTDQILIEANQYTVTQSEEFVEIWNNQRNIATLSQVCGYWYASYVDKDRVEKVSKVNRQQTKSLGKDRDKAIQKNVKDC